MRIYIVSVRPGNALCIYFSWHLHIWALVLLDDYSLLWGFIVMGHPKVWVAPCVRLDAVSAGLRGTFHSCVHILRELGCHSVSLLCSICRVCWHFVCIFLLRPGASADLCLRSYMVCTSLGCVLHDFHSVLVSPGWPNTLYLTYVTCASLNLYCYLVCESLGGTLYSCVHGILKSVWRFVWIFMRCLQVWVAICPQFWVHSISLDYTFNWSSCGTCKSGSRSGMHFDMIYGNTGGTSWAYVNIIRKAVQLFVSIFPSVCKSGIG